MRVLTVTPVENGVVISANGNPFAIAHTAEETLAILMRELFMVGYKKQDCGEALEG